MSAFYWDKLCGVCTKPLPLLSVYDCTKSDSQFEALLSVIEREYVLLWDLQSKEQSKSEKKKYYTRKYNNLLETLCFSLLQCYNHTNVVRLLPLILYWQYREDKKTMEVVKMTTEVIAWTSLHSSQILHIFKSVLDSERTPKLINNQLWKIRNETLAFLLQFICDYLCEGCFDCAHFVSVIHVPRMVASNPVFCVHL